MAQIKSDIQIAQEAPMMPIVQVAKKAGLGDQQLELYGKYKAKVDVRSLSGLPNKAKLVLVSAINPRPLAREKRPPPLVLRTP